MTLNKFVWLLFLASVGANAYLVSRYDETCDSTPQVTRPSTNINVTELQKQTELKRSDLAVDVPLTEETQPKKLSRNSQEEIRPKEEDVQAQRNSYRAEMRLNALRKLFSLEEEEESLLREKLSSAETDSQTVSAIVEEVLGEERASFYEEQRERSRDRYWSEQTEREVYYLSRRLELNQTQEAELFELEERIHRELPWNARSRTDSQNPQQRMQDFIRLAQERERMKEEGLREILSADQYKTYQMQSAQSAMRDLELWHGSE